MMRTTARLLYQYRFYVSLFSLVFGLRMGAFWYAGSPLPFYDQWIYAIHNLFLLHPTSLHISEWYTHCHNEHRILTTLLCEVLGYKANGYYDVTWGICVAALVRSLTAVLAFRLLKGQTARQNWTVWGALALVLAVPYSGYNALNGMQLSFYLVELCLLASVGLVLSWPSAVEAAEPRKKKDALYCTLFVAISVFALTSFTSAVAIPAATLAVYVFQPRERRFFWLAWGLSASGAALLVAIAPKKGVNLVEGLLHLPKVISWPLRDVILGTCVFVSLTIITVVLWRRRHVLDSRTAVISGILVFSLLNAGFLALKRGESAGGIHMRHFETLLPLSYCIGGIGLSIGLGTQRCSLALRRAAAGWLVLATAGLVYQSLTSARYFRETHEHRLEALNFYRQMFMEGGIDRVAIITTKSWEEKGWAIIDDPIMKYSPGQAFPVVARDLALTASVLSPDIVFPRPFSVTSIIARMLVLLGFPLTVLVHGLLWAAFIAQRREMSIVG